MKPPVVRSVMVGVFGLLLANSLAAAPYQPGDSFIGFSAATQKGEAYTFKAGDARFILFETAGESGESAPPKDPDWFKKNQALLVINISDFSSLKRRIAKSRMKDRPFQILVVEDTTVAARFPKESGKFTVLQLDDQGKVTTIRYATPGKELQDLITGTAGSAATTSP